MTAVPPDSSLVAPPPILQGRWLGPNETGAIVISQGFTKDLPDVRSGDTIQLSVGGRPTSWLVVGIAEPVGGRGGIFITEEGFEAASGMSQPGLHRGGWPCADGFDTIYTLSFPRIEENSQAEALAG